MKILTAFLLASTLAGGLASPLRAETTPATPSASATTAPATPTAAPDAAAKPMPDHDEAMRKSMAADRAALFEAHLAALRAGLTLSADQDKLWPPVEDAIRGFAKMRQSLRDMRMDARQDRDEEPDAGDQDPVAALKTYSGALLERAQALKSLSDAVDPLYATLSDDQKHRIPMLLRDMAPKRGPMARMVERFGENEGQEPDEMKGRDGGPMPRDRMDPDQMDQDRMDHDHMGHDRRGMLDRDEPGRRGMGERFGERDEPRYGMKDRRDGEDGFSDHHRENNRRGPSSDDRDDAED